GVIVVNRVETASVSIQKSNQGGNDARLALQREDLPGARIACRSGKNKMNAGLIGKKIVRVAGHLCGFLTKNPGEQLRRISTAPLQRTALPLQTPKLGAQP